MGYADPQFSPLPPEPMPHAPMHTCIHPRPTLILPPVAVRLPAALVPPKKLALPATPAAQQTARAVCDPLVLDRCGSRNAARLR